MNNILTDLYYLNPSKSGWLNFFRKWLEKEYPDWVKDNLEAFKERTGEDWFASKHFAGLLRDQVHVQEIIDDFFDRNTISGENLRWLQGLEGYLTPHLTLSGGETTGNELDLGKHRLVLTYYNVRHGIGLQPIFQGVFRGLVAMLQGEKMSIKKCQTCAKLINPTPGGFTQKYCSNACKIRAFRERKKAS